MEHQNRAREQYQPGHPKLDRQGQGLAEKDPRRVQAQGRHRRASARRRFNDLAAIDHQQGHEQHDQVEQTRTRRRVPGVRGPERESTEQQGHGAKGHDLPEQDPTTQLDAQVLFRHQPGDAKHSVLFHATTGEVDRSKLEARIAKWVVCAHHDRRSSVGHLAE